jgi:hypothetical protein
VGTEVDSIELQIETSAKQANRSLTGMQNRLKKIASTLSEIGSLAPKLNNIGGVDISDLKSYQKYLDGIVNKQKKLGSTTTKLKVDTSEIKKADQGFSALMRKYKDSKLRINFEAMNEKQLNRAISKLESGLNRYKQNVFDTAEQTGSAINQGKMWEKNIKSMFQYKNSLAEAMKAKEAFNTVKLNPDLTVTRNGETPYRLSDGVKVPEANEGLSESAEVSSGSIEKEARNLNEISRQAEKASASLKKVTDSNNTGFFTKFKSGISSVADSIRSFPYNLMEKLRLDDSSLGGMEKKAVALKTAFQAISPVAGKVFQTISFATKKAGAGMWNFAKSVASIKKSPLKILKSLVSSLRGVKDESGNARMSLLKMIGSSILFSTIFGVISNIKQAVKEGSDNLVQYSSEYNNSISGMVSSLLYLKNAWAVAFAPIVNAVGPYISAFIDMMARALNAVGQFMAALTGKGTVVQAKKAWKDYGKTISDTGSSAKKAGSDAKKAAKDFQTYTLGIDELNIQQKTTDSNSDSDSGGGSGGSYTGPSPSEMFETTSVDKGISDFAEKIREAIQNADWKSLGTLLGEKVNQITDSVDWSEMGKKVGFGVNGVIQTIYYTLKTIDFVGLGKNVASYSNSFLEQFDFNTFGRLLVRKVTALFDLLIGYFGNLDWKLVTKSISDYLIGSFEEAQEWIAGIDWSEMAKGLWQNLKDAISGIDFAGIASSFFSLLGTALGAAASFVFTLMYEIGKDIWNGGLDGILSAIKGIGSWIKNNIFDPFINGFKDVFGIHSPSTVMAGMGVYLIQGLINGAASLIGNVVKKFQEIYGKITSIFEKNKITRFFKDGFQSAYNAVTSIWQGISSFFKDIANKIISPIGDAVNGIINGINWVLEKLNSGTRLKKWDVPKFASGTNGVGKDTIGMVNDQPGGTYKEMIVPPNGKPFIPKGRNVVIPLEKGTKIMPANQTEALMGGMGVTHYANGIGDFFGGVWEKAKDIAGTVADYVEHPGKLLQIALNKFVDISNLLSPVSDIAGGIVKTIFKSAKDFIANMFSSSEVSGNVAYNVSAGVEQWRALAKKALELTNQYSEANLNALLMQMQHESGGNPNAINLWDSNAKAGIPSKGLMQVIDPTFRSNALPGYNTNIYDPLSNMIAAIRYTVGRYGSLNAGWTARGYKGYKYGIGSIGLSDILPKYTGGGFPEDGVFMANHEEMVGKFSNGRTAVANNNQIVDGISKGVYEAMLKAQSENTRETDLLRELIEAVKRGSRIVVDGRELVNVYDKRKNRNGHSFT